MAATKLLSDNGVSSGISGYQLTGGNDGTLQLQTTTSGGTATTAMTIDTSQNVGIGATPTGFPSGGTLTLPADKAITSAGNGLTLGNNWYYNSGDKFAGTGYATQYYQYNGTHRWVVSSASGSAGGAVTFNEAMRIDSSGNVGIGVTPNAWNGMLPALQIGAYGSAIAAWGSNRNLYALSNAYYNSGFKYSTTATASAAYYDISGETGTHSWYTAGAAASHSAGDAVTFTQAMMLDTSGALLVGTTGSSGSFRFGISGSGGTSGSSDLAFNSDSAKSEIQSYNNKPLYINRQGNTVFIGTLGTGTVYSSGGALSNTNPSDARLKDNVQDLAWGLQEVLQLRPVSYLWKDDPHGQGDQYGFIAQEVQGVMPALVREFKTEQDGEKVTRYGLEKDGIYAALVKAIQEQQALITTLTERITALENK